MKGGGVILPHGWRTALLAELVYFQRGFDITKDAQKSGDVPVISSSGIQSYHCEAMVQGPGVVIGRKGSLGTVYYTPKDYWPHDTTLWSKDFCGNHPKFVYYYLMTMCLKKYDVGSSNPTLNRNHIHGIPILIPNLTIQQKIASILSAYDDLIENNRRRIQLLEESARQLYKEWFVRLRFPGHEHVKVVDGVPEGWERKSISELVEINPTVQLDTTCLVKYIPMSALSCVGMTIDLGELELREKPTSVRFKYTDTLFARITPCLENGKTAICLWLDENELACGSTEFIVLHGKLISPWLTYILSREEDVRSMAIASMTGTSGRQRVHISCFEKCIVSLASRDILNDFDNFVQPAFYQIKNLVMQNHKLAQARDLLLPKLMSGEVAV